MSCLRAELTGTIKKKSVNVANNPTCALGVIPIHRLGSGRPSRAINTPTMAKKQQKLLLQLTTCHFHNFGLHCDCGDLRGAVVFEDVVVEFPGSEDIRLNPGEDWGPNEAPKSFDFSWRRWRCSQIQAVGRGDHFRREMMGKKCQQRSERLGRGQKLWKQNSVQFISHSSLHSLFCGGLNCFLSQI